MMGIFLAAVAFWAVTVGLNLLIARKWPTQRWARLMVPTLFGLGLIVLWEGAVRGFAINPVILPAPSQIAQRFGEVPHILWVDFQQTILKGALSGYIMGCSAAVLLAIGIDRSVFLQRGLLPLGNFVAALPIVGIAPIFVMWFGFDWQSKAAVVIVTVFFPVLINMMAGLRASDPLARDLMASYSASYAQTLAKLRLPAAMPFLFNGLKIATTLALIAAIVAEFFGSPTRGMGFRISTAVGQLDMPLVWAEIVVAALSGTGFYGLITLLEKTLTFWHPSQRG
ncbi:ABC transporter permease [Rhodobacteraceae bacterium]|nr:ABC transporter permease [Paracoccaceae bacterium]